VGFFEVAGGEGADDSSAYCGLDSSKEELSVIFHIVKFYTIFTSNYHAQPLWHVQRFVRSVVCIMPISRRLKTIYPQTPHFFE